jgi:hypothetical protein
MFAELCASWYISRASFLVTDDIVNFYILRLVDWQYRSRSFHSAFLLLLLDAR